MQTQIRQSANSATHFEAPKTVLIAAANNAAHDLLLESLRAGAREFLKLPISAEELKTVLDRVVEFCAGQVEVPRKKGRTDCCPFEQRRLRDIFIATNLAAW